MDTAAETETEMTETSNWRKVMEVIHTALPDDQLAEEATCQEMLPILKRGGKFHGIGLMEVICKTVAVILNRDL